MNDDRLREAFNELRREETAHVPRFDALWHVEPALSRLPSRLRGRSTLVFATLLLIVILLVLVPARHRGEAPSISTWRAPTDFLLKTPGQELLSSVPDLKGATQ